MKITENLYVTNRDDWRAWLRKNHDTKKEVWLIYYKKHTGKPRIPYNDAVEEALCFGWIDSIVQKIEGLMVRIKEAKAIMAKSLGETERLLRNTLRKIFFDGKFETVFLGTVCKTTSGGTPRRDRPDYFKGNIPWLKSGELNDSLIADSEEHITEEALQHSSAKIFPKGTLLIALYGATVGKTGILGMDSSTNQAICALFPQKDVLESEYLHWFLKCKRNDFLKNSFGGAQPNISQRLLRKTEIPLPSLSTQRRIVAYLNSLQEKMSELKSLKDETEREIEELIPSILNKAFKGNLCIHNPTT